MAKVIKDGYGQIELNRCSFLHDGNIEAQCKAEVALENGLIVAVDKAEGTVKAVAKNDEADAKLVYGVNYTSEKIYDQFTPGRKNFIVKDGDCPRVGILKAGDVFSTNAYLVNEGNTPEVGTVEKYGAISLLVAEITDTADGQTAVKYQVL
jgi:hypothetical protein